MIKLSHPNFSKKEYEAVMTVLKSGNLSQGKKVEEFEKEFANFLDAKYAVATSSGTAALHLVCLALGLKKGDQVLTTPFSFIASANAILFVGAEPVFVDIDETFNIDVNLVEKRITEKTKAILVVHLFGLPADMEIIDKIARKYDLKIIEDVSQAHGAKIGNRYVGTFGNAACFSFYATKNMTTGEGGMVVTDDKGSALKIRSLRNHGKDKKGFFSSLGYNFRMNEIEAALGIAQLKKLKTFNDQRIKNANYLNERLKGIKGVIIPNIPKDSTHVFHHYTLRIMEQANKTREKIVEALTKRGIEVGIFYNLPIHKQPLYKKFGYRNSLPVSEKIANEVISLPVHPLVTKKDLDFIVKFFKESLDE